MATFRMFDRRYEKINIPDNCQIDVTLLKEHVELLKQREIKKKLKKLLLSKQRKKEIFL